MEEAAPKSLADLEEVQAPPLPPAPPPAPPLPPAPAPASPNSARKEGPLTPAGSAGLQTTLDRTLQTNVPGELKRCWELMEYLVLVEPDYTVTPHEFSNIGKELCRLASMAKGSRNEEGAAAIMAERHSLDSGEMKAEAGAVLTRLHDADENALKSGALGLSLIALVLLG